MGQFRVEIVAVGGHGCEREALEGQPINRYCGRHGCPDCEIRRLLLHAKTLNWMSIEKAEFTHWPGTQEEVVDDLLNNKRVKGSFKKSV